MRKINESKYKTGKVITSFSNYVRFVNESSLYDPDEVNKKIRRVILWLNINQGFYAELLSHVNIFGSSDLNPKTMCTNGRDIIFHPEFVMRQSEAALRLVLCHEILHCIGDHMNRRGSRDPMGWNIACDYAINPLLKDEAGFEFPVDENGNREGLYDPRFEGMRAEDIYDALEESGELKKLIGDSKVQKTVETTGKVEDEDKELADPDEEMVIQKGDEPGEPGEDEEGEPGEGEPGEGEEGEPGEGEGEGEEGEPGEGEGQPGELEGEEGEPGEGEGQPEGNKKSLPRVGQKVITKDGREGTITKVYPNGDIEIS